MNIQKKVFEEKVRNVDFTNQAISRFVCYSNISSVGCEFLKDNGVSDFTLVDYIDDSDSTIFFDNESFL